MMDRSQRIGAIILSGAAIGLVVGIVLRPQTPPSPEPDWKARAQAQQEKPAVAPVVPAGDRQERELVWNSLVRDASSDASAGDTNLPGYTDTTASLASGPADLEEYPAPGHYVAPVPLTRKQADQAPPESTKLKNSLLVYRGSAEPLDLGVGGQ
jgi:hypothetical protein